MALKNYSFTALIDTDPDGDNIVSGQAVTVNIKGGGLASIYEDDAGVTAITQPGAVTDSDGVLSFYVATGTYTVTSGSRTEEFSVTDSSENFKNVIKSQMEAWSGVSLDDAFIVSDRANGIFVTVTKGVTPNVDLPNGYNIIESTADATKCFVLRGFDNIKQIGAAGDGVTDDGPEFAYAATLASHVRVPYSSSGYIIDSEFSGSESVFIVEGSASMITNNNEKSGCLIDIDTVDGTGGITAASVDTAGSNYVVGDVLSLFQGGLENGALRDPSGVGGSVTVDAVDGSGGVTAISITAAGADYSPVGALPDYEPIKGDPASKLRAIYTNIDTYFGGIPMAENLRDKSIGIVAGTIRQSVTKPSQWNYISNASHTPLGVPLDPSGAGYATANGREITINFNETYTKVISFIVGADETFSETYSMSVGASTGLSSAVLKANFTETMGHYTYWNGASWVEAAGTGQDGNPSFTYTSGTGILRIDHDYIPGLNIDFAPYTNQAAVSDPYVPVVSEIGNDYVEIQFLIPTTGLIYTGAESNRMCFTYSKQSTGKFTLDGSDADVPALDSGNLWFYGIFER